MEIINYDTAVFPFKELIKKAHGTGTAMMHVSKSSMENRKLRLPSLNKQKQIAKSFI